MHFTRVFSVGLFAVAVSACSSSSSGTSNAPVIDSLDVPSTVSVGTVQTAGGGTEQAYVLTGTLNFHDTTEKVDSFQVHVTSPANTIQDLNQSFDANNGPGPLSNGPIQVTLALPTGLGAGTKIDYEVTITSVSGVASASLSESVTLQ